MKTRKVTDFKRDLYLRVIRPLVQAYLAFHRLGSRHIEKLRVTPSQFDVLAELGDTPGLTCADLSDATLITKGTLTGVLDRLEAKGLLQRIGVDSDRRAIRVRLTAKGETLYQKIFPAHGDFLRGYLKDAFSPRDIVTLQAQLCLLRDSFKEREAGRSETKRKMRNGKTR